MLTQAFLRTFLPALAFSLSACVATEPDSSSSVTASSSNVATSSAGLTSSVVATSSSAAATNTIPQVSFLSPALGYIFDQGAAQQAVQADATDLDGNLESVALYIDNVLVSFLYEAPFRWSATVLNNLSAGDHVLRLIAEDSLGAKNSASNTISINPTINTNPSLSFTSPLDGDVLPFRSSVDVTITASDSDGEIETVLLLLNNQRVAQLTQSPFVWPSNLLTQLQNLPQGTYVLRAIATDNRGGTAVQEVSFDVLEQNDFPSASFLSPAPNLRLPVGSSLDVLIDASDADGDIEEVVLRINGNVVGVDTNPPYDWRAAGNSLLRDLPAGDHNLELTAVDDKGGQTKVTNVVSISNSASPSSGDPRWGEHQYQQMCMTCHGSFGEGGEEGASLIPSKDSYSQNGQSYSLYKFIDEFMPKGYVTGCVDQCARNVATYIKGLLAEKHADYSALVGDAATGKVEYQLHCAECHGDRGVGGTEDVPLFPLRTAGSDYMVSTYYTYSRVNLFAMIDLGMPLGPQGFPDGYAEQCSGQCVVDVIAHLKNLEANLTAAEKRAIQLASGKTNYTNYCAGCHGSTGSQRGLIPLSSQQRSNTGLDNNDVLFVYNRDRMPPSTPSACEGQCAKDVTLYIREVLD
jgi:mono/diheme cytochrome c family protein